MRKSQGGERLGVIRRRGDEERKARELRARTQTGRRLARRTTATISTPGIACVGFLESKEKASEK